MMTPSSDGPVLLAATLILIVLVLLSWIYIYKVLTFCKPGLVGEGCRPAGSNKIRLTKGSFPIKKRGNLGIGPK